jgi:hypothetical protein
MKIELSELWLIDPIHQPDADWLDDEKEALEVGKDFVVTVDGVRYVVPGRKYDKGGTIAENGFYTDLGTIPEFLWDRIAPWEKAMRYASVIHDWFYAKLCDQVTKEYADNVFYEVLRHKGMGAAKAWLCYQGVKLGGKGGWARKNTYKKPFKRVRR